MARKTKYEREENLNMGKHPKYYREGNLKECGTCRKIKNLEEFSKSSYSIDGHRYNCKICDCEKTKNHYKKNKIKIRASRKIIYNSNPDKVKDYQLRSKYKISLVEYKEMLLQQNNKCAICFVDNEILKKPLAVDHCHKNGLVHGLLCMNCNSAIGKLKEDKNLFLRAIKYLKL